MAAIARSTHAVVWGGQKIKSAGGQADVDGRLGYCRAVVDAAPLASGRDADVATMKIWLRDLTRDARDTPRRRSADQAATQSSAARSDVLESSSVHPYEPIEALAYGGVVSMKSEPTYLTSTAGEVTAAAGHAWRVVAVHQDVAQSLVAGGIGR